MTKMIINSKYQNYYYYVISLSFQELTKQDTGLENKLMSVSCWKDKNDININIYKLSITHEKGRAMLGAVGLREKGKYYSKEKNASIIK